MVGNNKVMADTFIVSAITFYVTTEDSQLNITKIPKSEAKVSQMSF